MKSKIVKIGIAMLIALATMFQLVACGRESGVESKDTSKTQLYVSNYDGGIGTQWLRDIKAKFEEENANVSFETGKMGVQIYIDPNKTEGLGFEWMQTSCDVVFIEKLPRSFLLTNAVDGKLMDLTDVMNNILAQPGVSLPANISNSLTSVNNKYYAIPHYEGGGGITYDKDLFNTKSFYLSKEGDYTNASGDLSVGPDGVPNTSDDGLPSTMEEFVDLCIRIKQRNCIPFCVSGAYKGDYLHFLLDRFEASYNGKEKQIANYSLSAESLEYITDFVENEDSLFGYDIVTLKEDIVDNNAYLLKQTPAKYYALSMLAYLIQNECFSSDNWEGTVSHLDAQENFIKSTGTSSPIAMLVEGNWWQNEAEDAFIRMEANNSAYGKMQRNFGWMPLPTKLNSQDGNASGDPLLTLDSLGAYCIARSDVSKEMQALIKKFIAFCYTQESLENFTVRTGMTRPFTYTLSSENYAKLSAYSKDIWKLHEDGKFVYVHSNNDMYSYNESKLFVARWAARVKGSVLNFDGDNPISVNEYFRDMWYTEKDWTEIFG